MYYFSISMVYLDITSASETVNAVPELLISVLWKVLKNVLKYIMSTYVLSTWVHFENVISTWYLSTFSKST